MRTTAQWWSEVSNDEEKMTHWLKNQYHGELTAAMRVMDLITEYNLTEEQTTIVANIAKDEWKHAAWVKTLLLNRDIEAKLLEKEDRYWKETIPATEQYDTFSYMCAVGHLAETMRLERITLLAADERFLDIANVFSEILVDELRHVEDFLSMTTKEDVDLARVFHNQGMNALGLEA